MTRRLRMALVSAACLLVGGFWVLDGDGSTMQQPSDETSREIMWTKLDLSHNVLDALAVRDFEALEAYAEDLEILGTEGFVYILDTEEYRSQAQDFRTAARALRNAAQEQNVEAGTLAYMDLTLRCIRCHRSLGVLPR